MEEWQRGQGTERGRRRGAGHHGCRHRRGARPGGPVGHRRRDQRRGAGPRPRAPRALHRPGGQPRQARPGRPRRDLRADPLQHLAGGPRRAPSWSSRPCPSAWSSRPRSSPQLDKICPPDTILATNTSSLSVTELSVVTGRPSKVIGMHFFNPAPVMKLVEVVRTVVTEPSVVDDVEALAARLGKVDVTIGDKAGLHRQRAAVRLPQPRRLDVREPLRQPRGHRRRHAAGLRPADGPAGADGPHRHRHRLRDPRHDVQAVAQPAARAQPDHQADDDRGPAGPEVRPRLLHLRRARARPRSSPTPHTPAEGGAAEGARPVQTVGVVGSGHHGHRHHRGRRQGRLRRPLRRPRAREGRGGAPRR